MPKPATMSRLKPGRNRAQTPICAAVTPKPGGNTPKPANRQPAPSGNTLPVDALKANARNPRTITPDAMAALVKSLAEFGDLGGIVVNRRTGQLVGGHQRVEAFKQDTGARVSITERLAAADKTGTVALGYVETNGTRFGYREVEWDVTKETAANIAANQHGGEFDLAALKTLVDELKAAGTDMTLTGLGKKELDDLMHLTAEKYSRNIEAPIYTPTRPTKPKLSELFTDEKTATLIERIKAEKLPPDEAAFLIAAAQRHTVFNFENIAEYYAHSPANVQRLMEQSALVLIDMNKAIEHGFVKFGEWMQQLVAEQTKP